MEEFRATETLYSLPKKSEKVTTDKVRSVCEQKRRKSTNDILNNIETLVYSSNPVDLPSKKIGKIQILEKASRFIRFYDQLVKNIDSSNMSETAVIPSDVLQSLFTYSQKGFLLVVDSTGQVICCSSSAMGCLQSPDTRIVGVKLSQLLTINDNDFLMSLVSEKRGEPMAFYIHFTINSDVMHTFSCRTFWHQFEESSAPESDLGMGALILACSSIDKLTMYSLPIFNGEQALTFEFKVSLDGKFMKINEETERYTGHTSSDLIGRCILDYVNWEQTVELITTMTAVLHQSGPATICLQFCCKSKSLIWIQASIRASQNLWNSRVESFIFRCETLDYNEIMASKSTLSASLFPPGQIDNPLESTSSQGPTSSYGPTSSHGPNYSSMQAPLNI